MWCDVFVGVGFDVGKLVVVVFIGVSMYLMCEVNVVVLCEVVLFVLGLMFVMMFLLLLENVDLDVCLGMEMVVKGVWVSGMLFISFFMLD